MEYLVDWIMYSQELQLSPHYRQIVTSWNTQQIILARVAKYFPKSVIEKLWPPGGKTRHYFYSLARNFQKIVG